MDIDYFIFLLLLLKNMLNINVNVKRMQSIFFFYLLFICFLQPNNKSHIFNDWKNIIIYNISGLKILLLVFLSQVFESHHLFVFYCCCFSVFYLSFFVVVCVFLSYLKSIDRSIASLYTLYSILCCLSLCFLLLFIWILFLSGRFIM